MSVTVRETGRTHDAAGRSWDTQADAVTGAILDGGGTVTTTVTLDVTVVPADPPVDPQDPADQPVPVAATANGHDGNVPGNVLDGDPDTRWSHDAAPSILDVELAELSMVAGVDVEQYYSGAPHGDGARFNLSLSSDGQTWTRVYEGGSDGVTDGFERYTWTPTAARFLRYEGSGRPSRPSPWNSITRLRPLSVADLDTPLPPQDDPDPEPPPGDVAHGLDLTAPDNCPNPTPGSGNVGLTVPVSDLTLSGPVATTRDGQVIENLDIWASSRGTWAVTIRHDNVTVRNCRIRHADGAEGIDVNGNYALIEHNHLCAWELSDRKVGSSGSNNNVGQRTLETDGDARFLTIRRNYVHLARSAFAIRGKDIELSENYVDQLVDDDGVSPHTGKPNSPGGAPLHGTASSSAGDGRRNRVLRNRMPQGSSGGVIIYSRTGSHSDWDVLDNYFPGSGKGFAIYGGRSHSSGYYTQNRNIRIEGNRFSGTFGYASTRGRGTNAAVDLSRPGNTFDNNRFVGENTDLPARCGIASDSC